MKKVDFVPAIGPVIVLVRPQMAENVGMVARAMMNCGLTDLRLVAPRESHLSEPAVRASSGAQEILMHAMVFDTLESAVADMHRVMATTARVRDMTKRVLTPVPAVIQANEDVVQGCKVAWLFGPERTGLENVDLALADTLVQIPLNPAHSSLNLSQAVLIMAYHWWMRDVSDQASLYTGGAKMATKREMALFLAHLDAVLQSAGYYAFPDKCDRMQRNLHNIFTRMDLTSSEIKTLYNVLTCLKK